MIRRILIDKQSKILSYALFMARHCAEYVAVEGSGSNQKAKTWNSSRLSGTRQPEHQGYRLHCQQHAAHQSRQYSHSLASGDEKILPVFIIVERPAAVALIRGVKIDEKTRISVSN